MFQETELNTESVPSNISYKSFKTYLCKRPTVISKTLSIVTADATIRQSLSSSRNLKYDPIYVCSLDCIHQGANRI